jgi:CheY-like chemotaxis protein
MDQFELSHKKILIVDDEVDLREIVASELEFAGATIFQAENVLSAQEILDQQQVDLIVSDIRMPGATGIDLLKYIKSRDVKSPPIILITGFADITLQDAYHLGAEALINKPFKLEELIRLCSCLIKEPSVRLSENKCLSKVTLKQSFDLSLDAALENQEIKIGRGGMSLKVDMKNRVWDGHDVINFELQFKDQRLQGLGNVRWWKPLESSSQIILGLEFSGLDTTSLNLMQNIWHSRKITPYIPSL